MLPWLRIEHLGDWRKHRHRTPNLYLLAAGLLYSLPVAQQSATETLSSFRINAVNPIRLCEAVLSTEEDARICLINSESAIKGSYDMAYATAKAAMHEYWRMKTVREAQYFGLISPPIISDAGMTLRRHDYPDVLHVRRHVTSRAVAEEAERMLFGPDIGKQNRIWPQ